jgi:putative FmdB family regulatory protein
MPVYEYQCGACNKELEVMQRITEKPLEACPSCGGKLQRLISNTGFILKGTGWYATDYARRSSSSWSDAKSSGGSDSGSSGSSESSSTSSKDD